MGELEALTAQDVVDLLELQPHPEGGWYRETWRHAPMGVGVGAGSERGAGTAILYLLGAGQVSHWHRVDAVEIWHYYAGAPLDLSISLNGETLETQCLGARLAAGERPQLLVPEDAWQSARSRGAWTLAGCTVSPAFEFAGFELAPPGWSPGAGRR